MRIAMILLLFTGVALADAPPPASPANAAAATTATEVSPEVLKTAKSVGLKQRTKRGGVVMYCKDEAKVGTRFETETCYTAEQLPSVVQDMKIAQENARKASACGGKACGGN